MNAPRTVPPRGLSKPFESQLPGSPFDAVRRRYPDIPGTVYSKRTLIDLSHAMEDQALLAADHPIVLATFQTARFVAPELERYRLLARQSPLTVMFARAASSDVDAKRDGVIPVDLAPDDPLCDEWHVVVMAHNFMALLLCREVGGSPRRLPDPRADLDRQFESLWTFEPDVVRYAATLFLKRVQVAWPAWPLPALPSSDGGAAAMPFVQPLTTRMLERLERASHRERQRRLELERSYEQSLRMLSGAVEAKDHVTGQHVVRVAALAEALGRRLGWSVAVLRDLRYGASLHDIGKIGVPEAVLSKPGKLNDEELVQMRRHPVIGAEILGDIAYLRQAAAVVRHHHERWDGTGYPDGLAGDAISPLAQVVAIADVYDALGSDRPYRTAWPQERVLDLIRSESGRAFAPPLVQLLLDIIAEPHA